MAAAQAKHNEEASRKELTAEGELYFPFDRDALDLLRAFPPAPGKPVWDKERKCRHISLSAADRPRVLELCEKLGIKVHESLQKVPMNDAVKAALDRCRDEESLFDFQVPGVSFLALREKALLGDDMGLGKTIQALVALDPKMGAFVVCPSAVKYNWADEIKKWRSDLTVEVLSGRDSFRWPEAGEVVISNFEILPKWLIPVKLGELANGKPMMGAAIPEAHQGVSPKSVVLIVDEAHRVKNYRTQVHKKVKELARLCGKVWFLTGTPLMNRPTDLYGLLQAGHMDREVFGGWRGFVRCFNGSRTGWNGAYEWGDPTPEARERLRRVMLRRKKEDVLADLPSTVYHNIVVNNLSASLKKELDALNDEYAYLLDEGYLPPFEAMSKVRAALAKTRIPAMVEMVEDFEESEVPLVVFSAYKAPIEELGKREGWEIITGEVPAADRMETIRRFQNGELKGIGLTIAAGGIGITLTHASNVLFVDLDWTPALNAQAVDRVRRIGQTAGSIQISRMMSNHALDRRVHQLLAEKMDMIHKAVEKETEYQAKAPDPKATIEIKHETDEEYEERMAKLDSLLKHIEGKGVQRMWQWWGWCTGRRRML